METAHFADDPLHCDFYIIATKNEKQILTFETPPPFGDLSIRDLGS